MAKPAAWSSHSGSRCAGRREQWSEGWKPSFPALFHGSLNGAGDDGSFMQHQ